MINRLRKHLENGPLETSCLCIGGNMHVTHKVKIHEVDDVGMVCQIKGLMGGYGEMQVRPWSNIGHVSLP